VAGVVAAHVILVQIRAAGTQPVHPGPNTTLDIKVRVGRFLLVFGHGHQRNVNVWHHGGASEVIAAGAMQAAACQHIVAFLAEAPRPMALVRIHRLHCHPRQT
jgi:hypothetical protein